MRCLRIMLALAVLTSVLGCTTLAENPGRYRETKSRMIGVPGAMVHPNRRSGLAASLALPEKDSATIYSGEAGARASTLNDAVQSDKVRSITSRRYGIDLYSLYFPWDSSFFFIGVGVRAMHTRSAYNEHTTDFNLSGTMANVEWIDDSIWATLPLGLAVNTKEGLTNVGGFAPRRRISQTRRFVFDGADQAVDVAQREATLKSFDQHDDGLGIQLVWVTGYSF